MIKQLLKSSAIYTLSSLLSRGMVFILLPVYTRILSTTDYGVLDLITISSGLINNIVALQISQSVARFLPEYTSEQDKVLISSTALWFTLFSYGVFLLCSLPFYQQITALLTSNPAYNQAIFLGLIYAACNGVWILVLDQLRWEIRTHSYAVLSVIFAFLNLLLGYSLTFIIPWGLNGILISLIISALISLLLAIFIQRHRFQFIYSNEILKVMLAFSLPLVPAAVMSIFTLYANRIAVNHFVGLADLGILSVATKVASVVSLLMIGFRGSLTPLIYQHYKEAQTPATLATLLNYFIAAALVACLCMTIIGRSLLLLLSTSDYLVAYTLIGFLALAVFLNESYIFFPGIAIKKKTNLQVRVSLYTFVITIISCIVLVPIFGIYGAAASSILGGLAFISVWAYFSQQNYPLPVRFNKIILALTAFFILNWVGILLDQEYHDHFIGYTLKVFLLLIMIGICHFLNLINLFIIFKFISGKK